MYHEPIYKLSPFGGIQADFFRFFGSMAEEYTSRRLQKPREPEANIASGFKNLVVNNGYSILHIIFYTRENVMGLEFNNQGDSRHRIITSEQAEKICLTNCVYEKDIHRNSSYWGKISVAMDLSGIVENFFKHNFQQDDQIKIIIVGIRATADGCEGRFFTMSSESSPISWKKSI